MPQFEYDKDYPFAAFVTNLGKYNEGHLVGEWVKFPTTEEEMKQVFARIGIGSKGEFGQSYEEWFITDYDCYVDGLYDKLGEYESLDELNYLASKLDEMSQGEYEQFQAAMEIGDHSSSVQEIINLTENLDCYDIYPGVHDHNDLGRYYIEELDSMQVPEHLQNYIDYEAYGRDVALDEAGDFTSFGYVRDTGNSFHEYYDGEHGSIPEVYRVMTFQDAELAQKYMEHFRQPEQFINLGGQIIAVPLELEKDNPLRTAEMTLEDDYNMIDGVINNGRRGEETEKAAESSTEKKPSIRERLEDARKECSEHKPPEKGRPGRDTPEHGSL